MSKQNTEFSLSDSIERMENKIRHFQSNQGYNSKIITKYQLQLGKMFNSKAEQDLQSNKLESCYQYLQKALQLSLFIPSLKFQTLNNLALYHQQKDQPKIALYYLNQVLKMQYQQQNDNCLANTYLNISAIQSSINCHDEALSNIYFSIILLQHELLVESLKYNLDRQKQSNSHKLKSNLLSSQPDQIGNEYLKMDRVQILIAAYHNLSIEMEFLKRNDESKKIIESAHLLSQYIFPPGDEFRQKLQNIVDRQVQKPIKHKTMRSISFDDKDALRNHKAQKNHFYRQFSKQNNQLTANCQNNPITKLQNTPPKLLKHQKWITEITQPRSSHKLSQTRNISTICYTLNLE